MSVEEIIRKYALQNAIFHDGKADAGAVLSKIIAEKPELKTEIKKIFSQVKEIVIEINSLSPEKQKKELENIAPELLVKEKKEIIHKLPELQNVVPGNVVLRFAPGPSGPLHIGHSRAAVLNDEYAKLYSGKLINRIEDTDPDRIDPNAYQMIKEDLDWLGVKVHQTVLQSDRFEIYYQHAKELLEMACAYVCTCRQEDWRKLKLQRKPCKHREQEKEKNLADFDKMLNGFYKQEEATVIVKTDLSHPNPALRDFVALRILDTEHPKTGTKYTVYPLMNFAVAVDDHFYGLTHVLRGKDHLNNTYRQGYIFDYFGWKKPEYIHYGRVAIEGTVLKTSLIKEGIKKKEYTGWDDVRLSTIRALAKRGIQPEAIRKCWVAAGVKEVDISLSWENLYALNKESIDKKANRYFFVCEPIPIKIENIDKLEGHAPLHPDMKERGVRKTALTKPITVFVCKEDLEALKLGDKVRLKDLCNVELSSKSEFRYIGQDMTILKEGAKIIHWVSGKENIPAEVILPDGSVKKGLAEVLAKRELGNVVQFERFGFVRIDKAEKNKLICYFAHK